jgi:hypothetical protein
VDRPDLGPGGVNLTRGRAVAARGPARASPGYCRHWREPKLAERERDRDRGLQRLRR